MINRTKKERIVVMLLYIVVIIAIGLFALNQGMKFYYNSELLQAPCKLCLELNPEVEASCFNKREEINNKKINLSDVILIPDFR